MSDLINLGLTGLRTSRNNLTVTGHNISNIDTPGFSRQRAVQVTNPAFGTGHGYVGQGARTQTIERIVDRYVVQQVRVDSSRLKDNDAFLKNVSELDNLLANESSALGTALNKFFDAVQSVSNDPLSSPARELLYSQASSISQRFKSSQARLNDQNNNINSQLHTYAARVNELSGGIGDLNREIRVFQGSQKQPPNDLLDRREELLRQLSEIVEVDVFEQDGLDINVFIGSGVPLIVGQNVNQLEAVPGQFDKSRYDVNLVDLRGSRVNINASITGGSMGGVMRYRSDTLDPALNEMGRLSMVLAGEFNNQHRQGVDLNGDQGGDFFRDINTPDFMMDRIPGVQRKAPAGVWLNPEGLNRLPASEFMLRQTADGLVLSGSPQGQKLGTFGNIAQLNDFLDQQYGFRLTDAGAGSPPADLDAGLFATELEQGLLVAPVRLGASQLERSPALSDTNKLALSGIAADEHNAGSASLHFDGLYTTAGSGGVKQPLNLDAAGLALTGAKLVVDPATANTPPLATDFILTGFPAGSAVTGYDDDGQLLIRLGAAGPQELRLDVRGEARAGDSWLLEGRAGGNNGKQLALLQSGKLIGRTDGGLGGASLSESYAMLVEKVGIQTSESRTATEVGKAVLNQTEAMRESVSGVNMDEEATNLIRFQQAYQASSQVIAAAQRMFDTLLSSVGR